MLPLLGSAFHSSKAVFDLCAPRTITEDERAELWLALSEHAHQVDDHLHLHF